MFTAFAQGGFKDGIDYFKAGYPEEAGIILTNTINQPETDQALANYYLGCVALGKNDKAAAADYFQKGIAADPKCGYNYIGQGQLALMNDNSGEAEKLFKEGIATNKKNGALYAAVARAYFNVNPIHNAKQIEKYLAEGNKVSKFKESDIFVLQGDMAANNPGDAAGFYETAIVTDQQVGNPVSPEAFVKYAKVYFRVNPQYSIDKLKELKKLQPNSALAQRELAEKYYDNNQLTLAAEEYGRYINNPNHFIKDEQRYCGLLFFGKKYDKSLEEAKKVLAKEPGNLYMQRMVMYNLYELGQYDAALAAAQKFFAETPKADLQPKDYEYEGNIYLELKKYPEALAAFKAGSEAFPDRTDMLDELAKAYNYNNDFAQAAQTMQRYIDTGDRSLNDIWDLADYYKNWGLTLPEGSADRAAAATAGIKAIDSSIEKAPGAGQLYRTKSQLLQVADSKPNLPAVDAYKQMIAAYEKAGDTEKRKGQIIAGYMYIGQYFAQEKDMAQARENYQKALALDPSNTSLANYIKTLK